MKHLIYRFKVFLWHIRQLRSLYAQKSRPIGFTCTFEIHWSKPNLLSNRARAIQAFEDPHPGYIRNRAIQAENEMKDQGLL